MKIQVKQIADDNPGLMERYRKQEVERSPEVPICVIKDGLCNHADTDIDEELPNDSALICTKCGAWKYAYDPLNSGWNNEVFLEEGERYES